MVNTIGNFITSSIIWEYTKLYHFSLYKFCFTLDIISVDIEGEEFIIWLLRLGNNK